jgi:hypothetical protein
MRNLGSFSSNFLITSSAGRDNIVGKFKIFPYFGTDPVNISYIKIPKHQRSIYFP